MEPELQQHVVGLERGVREEVSDPVALRLLAREQRGRRPRDGAAGRLRKRGAALGGRFLVGRAGVERLEP